jgi:hypothetical protein
MEYSSVSCTTQIVGAVTKNYVKDLRLVLVLSYNQEYLIIQLLLGPLCARLKEVC